MSTAELFARFTDTYERPARLYPALLAGAPLVAIAAGIYGVTLELKSGAFTAIVSIGVVYLLSTIARELGKRLEDTLYASWGGKPTTQLLRHRDRTLENVTKARYHAFLSSKVSITFPTPQQELDDPVTADDTYASAARWLLDRTRDRKRFPLLFKELVAYGFRRNCLGLRPIAIVISFAAFGWILMASGVITYAGFDKSAITALPTATRLVALVNFAFLLIWIFFFTDRKSVV